jgi:predicted phage tail protein
MKRKIILLGRMGELFGKEHELVCKNVHEAMHAIDQMKGGVRKYLLDCTDKGIEFHVSKGSDLLDYDNLHSDLGENDLIITPLPQGADFLKALLGVALIILGVFTFGATTAIGVALIVGGGLLALKGIVDMLTPEMPDDESDESNLFKGPINNAKVGIPVPLAYGKLEVGGAPINFGFTDTKINASNGFTFGKKDGTYSGSYSGGTGGGSAGGGSGGGSGGGNDAIASEEQK